MKLIRWPMPTFLALAIAALLLLAAADGGAAATSAPAATATPAAAADAPAAAQAGRADGLASLAATDLLLGERAALIRFLESL